MAKSFSTLKRAVGKLGYSNDDKSKEKKDFKDLKVSDYDFSLVKSDLEREIGFHNFSSDLESLNKTIYDTYNGWQTSETMKNTKSSLESMYDRLGSYKTYQRLFGDKGNDANIDDLRGSYRKAIEGWDTLASEYSIYKNAEAHSKEKAKLTELYSMNSSDIEPYLKDKNKPIAYTTATGENIKWQDLYNLTKVKELEDEVKNDKNFAENSKYEKKDVEYQRAWGSAYSVASDKDAHEYNYINKDKSAVEHEQLYSVLQYNTNDDEKNAYFKPEEIAIYNALAKTQGYDKAREYVKLLSPTLRQRRIEAERIHDAQMATENPFGSSFASVIGNVGNNMIGLPLTIADAIDGDGIDENSSLYRGKRQVDTIRGTVEDNIDNDVGKFFYRHGMNVADNLATMAVSGGGKLGNVSKVLQSGLYASGAFTDTVLDAKSRGLSDEKAMTLGAISAAAETYFESKSFEKFFDSDTLSNSAWKYFVNNLKTELFGELATEGVSDVADILLSQDVSQWKLETDKYKASGMTGKEAFNKAFKNAAFKYLDVGAGSIFSTGVMAGPSAIGGAAVNHHANKAMGKTIRSNERVGDMLDLASTMTPDEASAYEAYTRYAKKGINADNITDAQLGNLYHSTMAEATKGLFSKGTTVERQERALTTKNKLNEIDNDNLALKEAKANTQSGKENASNFTQGEVTEVASTGNSTTIQGIKVDGDNTTLVTTEGEVKSSDMNFSTRDADLVGHAQFIAKEHGNDVGNVFLQQYDGKTDVNEYAEAFNLVMTYADKNYTQDTILARKGILSAEQATEIYKATVHQQFEAQQKAVDAIVERQGKSMTIKGTFDDSIIDRNSLTTDGSKVNWNTLTTKQRNAINFARMFSKATGVNIRLIKSEVVNGKRKGENGSYDPETNTISIDVYAGIIDAKSVNDSIIPTLSHEITHWAKAKASAIYETLRDDVMKTLEENDGITSEKRIAAELARLKEAHPEQEFTEEDAIDEIIARSCEDMLSNSNYARKLLNKMSPKEQKKFREKIKETFDNLMQWVNDLLAQYKSTSDEAEVLRRYKYKLQNISKTWDSMIESAVGANQALQREGVLGETLVNGISKDGTTIVGDKAVQMSERTYREGGRDFLKNWLDNQEDLSDADKKDILDQTDAIANLMKSIREGNDLPEYSRWANMEVVKDENGEKVLSVIVKNGDYAMNIDFSQVCKKRVALNAVLNAMVQSGDLNVYTLTETDVADLNAIIKKHDFEIACALCFVDSKRYRIGSWAESFCEGSEKKKSGKMVHQYGFNEMVRSLVPKGSNIKIDEFNFTGRDIIGQPTTNLLSEADDSELDFSLIDEIIEREYKPDGKSTDLYAYAKAIRDNKDIRKILNPAEIISSIGLDNIRLESPEVYRLINRHQGTARPKFSHDIVAYGNDILKAKNFTAEKAKMVGGVRCQSFSDFMANMVMDYAQFISELSAKQLTAHTYTKEPLFVKLFGLTGMKINMSLVPKAIDMTPEQQKKFAILKDKNANKRSPEYKQAKAEYDKLAVNAGLDENGNYIWEDETFPYDVAMDIVIDPRYSANCGTIAVGISDRHILKLLDDDRISMIIPYHKSGLNHEVAVMRDIALYKDYTKTQSTRFANGKKLEKTPDFDFYGDLYGTDGKEGTHDPKKTTENYLKWCDEHNYIPKFEISTKSRKFRDNPNYYKLLTDFRVYDTDGTYREQQPVKTIYPSNDEFKDLILNGVTDKDGKVYGGLKQQQATTDKLSTESQQIIDEYREVLKEKYGKDVLKKQYSDRNGKTKSAEELSETDFRYLLEQVQYGNFDDGSYIPLRISTPEFFIDVVREHSEGKYNVMHVPLVSRVEHMRQNMDEEDDASYGNKRPHNLSIDDVVSISKEMGHPAYIVLQQNGRYAMVVSFYNSRNKKVVVSIDFASDEKPVKNYKDKMYMNGYNAGFYNIVVTQFEPDDLSNYLNGCEVVYDKKKMNGRYQVGSGRVVTFTHDTPFIDDSIPQPSKKVNTKFSDRDSAYMEAVESGDMEAAQNLVDKAAKEAGYNRRMFHETNAENIHVFDISMNIHGETDSETPYGIFTKSHNNNIGLGNRQMSLFVKAEKTLNVVNRADVKNKIPELIPYYDEIARIDKHYDSLTEKLGDEELDILEEWLEEHPDIDMDDVYPTSYIADGKPADIDSTEYLEAHERYQNAMDEWKQKYGDIAVKCKEIITSYLRNNGYDSMYFVVDGGSRGRQTDSLIVLDSNQVKSADTVTYDDNGSVIPLSERFNKANEDIRYSDRIKKDSAHDLMGEGERLEAENAKLKADVERLRERLALEKKVTNGNHFNENQLNAVANHLRTISKSTLNKDSVIVALREIYSYIAHSPNLAWDEVLEMCYSLAETMLAEAKPEVEVNDFYKHILKEIKSTRITLDNVQKGEAEARFGKNYNRYFFGKVILANDGISLDRKWQEWAEQYPGIFDAESTDQVGDLFDIINKLHEASEVVVEYDAEEQARWLANEIYNQYWNVSTIKTTADKYDKKLRLLNFEHRRVMTELREDYNTRLKERLEAQKLVDDMHYKRKLRESGKKAKEQTEKVKLAYDMHYGRLLRNLEVKAEQRLDKTKAQAQEKFEQYKENAERKTRIQSITSTSFALSEMLVKNSKDKHVPEVLKGPVITLLNAIDFSSKKLLDKNIPTNKDISLSKALSKVKDMMKDASDGNEELTDLYGHGMDDDIKALVESVDDIMRTIGDNEFILNKMTLSDLKTLEKMVKTIKFAVNKVNKFHVVNHAKGIANLSQESMLHLDSLGKGKIYDGKKGLVKKLLDWGNALPYYVFKRYGSGGMKVYEALQNGWDNLAFNVKKIMDYAKETYTSEEVKAWEKEIKTFKILIPATEAEMEQDDYEPQYQTIQMTVPQIMSIYCLYKREQARKHLFQGGIRVADFKNAKGEIVSQSDGVIFTEKDISTILDSLTDRQKNVADKLQEFMNTVCSEWGNEVSMLRFGYKAFGEENYFPVQSDKNNLAVNDETEQNNSLFKLLNMSFTKSLNDNANNRIVISNIFDVFAQHTSDMAKYNALALPVLDSFKWYNYTEKQPIADGTFRTKGVKQSIEYAFGKDGQNYFTTFLKDINGQQEVSRDTLGKGFFSNAKIAAVGANLRVMLLQPTSYFRASAVIDNIYLAKAFRHKPKIKMAETHCGIALWKSMGYFDTNIQRGIESQIKHDETLKDKIVDKTMKGAEIADKITWGYLWNACELEVRDKRKDLEVGTEEFYQAIAHRLREVIYATQVVDSTMTRSHMMRSTDRLDKMLTAFASETTLSYNMVQDAFMEYSLDKRKMGKKEAIHKNKKRIARILTAYTVTNAIAALVESGFDAFRDDDDEEMDVLAFMKLYLNNFSSDMSITGKIPYIKEIHSMVKGFSSSRSDTQWMEHTTNALIGWWKLFNGKGNASTVTKNTIKSASEIFGLPFYNVYRDAMALLNKIDLFTTEDLNEMFEDFFE